jgi:hypothetical protein
MNEVIEAAEVVVSEGEPPVPARPAHVPEKFWDAKAGTLRVDALLKSYLELERRLARSVPLPESDGDAEGLERLRRALGVPECADGYEIDAPHALVAPDADLNAVLHSAGFTPRQVQLVYDLAAERLLPLLAEAVAEVEAERQNERLCARFGGQESWQARARQLSTWGHASMPAEVFQTLARTYEGVLALDAMMRAQEPSLGILPGAPEGPASESGLQAMISDPRYWRDRDPAFVGRVTDGFRRLYANG